MTHRVRAFATSLVVIGSVACSSPDLRSLIEALPAGPPDQEWHVGPDVHIDDTGPARFVATLSEAFDEEGARRFVEFVDGYYRAPANEGYDIVIDRLMDELFAAGFGGDDERFQLEILADPPLDAWTPVSGEVVLLADGEEPHVLHAFSEPGDVDRVMLPVNAPSCGVEGAVAFSLDEIKKGMILVTEVSASQVMQRARSRGAIAVVSASLETFNEDTSGKERHHDAIQFRTLTSSGDMPVAQISRRSLEAIEAAAERAAVRNRSVRIRLKAEVVVEPRPLRTVVATIRGDDRPDEAVAMVSHVQEPGACDNATGVAGLLESATSLSELLLEEKLPWPSRSLVFIWGDEFRQSQVWLARTDLTPIVGISSDMTGQSKDTGARALLERSKDPGALRPLPPDAHTPWGAGEVEVDELVPSGLAVIARCAMIDVGMLEGGGWECADHPWEGGSDHDIFINEGIPAVLFWHFTDFTYHTSLDRMEYVDPAEMRRTGVALLATAMAAADPLPEDLDRYVKSLEQERLVRVSAARGRNDAELEELWETWCKGAREWLRNQCLGISEELPKGGR